MGEQLFIGLNLLLLHLERSIDKDSVLNLNEYATSSIGRSDFILYFKNIHVATVGNMFLRAITC